ncbi:MAG TPA: Rieske 2Fe-2S domain-containing protein [Kofleriaceae bacterium]|nr:Rieske 2Fe-2S domain-containing protein [Kofleriaceae bacterium]
MALRLRVCRVDEVPPGARRAVVVPGMAWPVLVVNLDGELVVSAGVCPHEDVDLTGGSIDDGVITCPGHSYEFDLRTGRCTHDARLILPRYRVSIIGDEIWIDAVG